VLYFAAGGCRWFFLNNECGPCVCGARGVWLRSLGRADLLALMLEHAGSVLDKQDCDGLVQLSFQSYPDGHKDAIINRIAEHLNRPTGGDDPK
jgi:hypothetical protein